MIVINKWHLVLVGLMMIALGAFLYFILKPSFIDDKKLEALFAQIAASKISVDTSREIYNNSRVESKVIVERWQTIHDSILLKPLDSIDCNLKLMGCSRDICRMDTALSNCDTLVARQDKLIKEQDASIDILKAKKSNPFGIFGGIGVGVNHKGQINPTAVIGLGIKIK